MLQLIPCNQVDYRYRQDDAAQLEKNNLKICGMLANQQKNAILQKFSKESTLISCNSRRLRPANSALVGKPSVFRPANFVAWELYPYFCLFDARYEPNQAATAGSTF